MKDDPRYEFLNAIISNQHFKQLKESFSCVFGDPLWWIISNDNAVLEASDIGSKQSCSKFHCCAEQHAHSNGEVKDIIRSMKLSNKDWHLFLCNHDRRGFCMPLDRQSGKSSGYLVLCHMDKNVTDEILRAFKDSVDVLIAEVQKDMEINRLYETVRPRAVALSTIHTVHRLISSILKLDELLPRVARLVLQVLRADYCCIMLIDESKKQLIPKTVIDLTGGKTVVRVKSIGCGIEGRVAENGNAVVNPDLLCVPLLHENIIGIIKVERKKNPAKFSVFDKEILWTLAEQAVIAIKNAQLYEQQEKLAIGSIKSLAAVLKTKSQYAYTHTSGFVKLALEIGRRMIMSQEELQYLHYAALMPDAGKAWVPEKILKKPSGLTKKEYTLVKQHPLKGVELIKYIDVLKPCIPIVLHHHERYDGSGYPSRLKGSKIPLGARIMAICDAFEAMLTKRPYRSALSLKQVMEEINAHSGDQFDPVIVKILKELYQEGYLLNIEKLFQLYDSQKESGD